MDHDRTNSGPQEDAQERLGRIFTVIRHRLVAFIQKKYRNAGPAEDVVDDAFERVLDNLQEDPRRWLEAFGEDRPLSSLLFCAASRRAIDAIRKRRRTPPPVRCSTEDDPDKRLILRQILDSLTPEERHVLDLWQKGHSGPEISTELNLAEGRVRRVLDSARKKVRDGWGER